MRRASLPVKISIAIFPYQINIAVGELLRGWSSMTDISEDVKGSKRRRAGIILSYVYTISQVVVNLLYVPILLRGIGASEYGLYQIIGSVMAYILLMNSTFSGGVTRFYCKYFAEGDVRMMETTLAISRRIYNFASVASVGIGAVAIIAVRVAYSNVLTDFQMAESAAMLLVLIANLVVTMHNTIDVAVINANERFSFLKITQIACVIVQPMLIILLIQWQPYAISIVCVQFVMNFACFVVQRVYRGKVLRARIKLHSNDKSLMKAILKFSSGILLVLLADQVFWRTNQLIVGFYFGTSVVAVYGVASQIYAAYGPMGTAISSVFMPRISALYYSDKTGSSISELFIRVGRIAAYPLLLVLLGFFVFGKEFISMWAGGGYEDAYLIALLVMVPYTVDLMQNLGLTIMQVENKYYFRGAVYSVLAIVNLIAVLFVTPHYGSIGAAACTGILMFIGNGIVMNAFYSRAMNLDIIGFWKQVSRAGAPLVLFGLLFFFVKSAIGMVIHGWISFAAGILLFGVLFVSVALLFSMNAYEKGLIKNLIYKVLKKQ